MSLRSITIVANLAPEVSSTFANRVKAVRVKFSGQHILISHIFISVYVAIVNVTTKIAHENPAVLCSCDQGFWIKFRPSTMLHR